MKKLLMLTTLVAALAAVAVVPAYAAPAEVLTGPGGPGRGDGDGPLHDRMIAAAAELLGLEAAEVEARLGAGETLSQIAVDQGLTLEEFLADWAEARRAVFEQAVEDGLIHPRLGWRGSRFGAGCAGADVSPSS